MRSNRITKYRQIQNWENFFMDSAIYSVGQSVDFSYEEGFQIISAITGDLFAYMYSEEEYCDSGYTNSFFVPEAVKEAYALFGYSCIFLSQDEICEDMNHAVSEIRKSVDRGIPVLAWGCGGVKMGNGEEYNPLPEGALIGGYDENNLLYVNLYPGAERLAKVSACRKPGVDEYGYTAIFAEDALKTTQGIFIIGEKTEKTELSEIYRHAISAIPKFLSMEPKDGYFFGKEAFETWAAILKNDAYWQNAELAEANWWDKHANAYCALCTSIGVGDGEGIVAFMKKAAAALPDVPETEKLLPLFEKLRAFVQSIWDIQGGFVPPFERFAEHDYREQLAGILCEMGMVCREIKEILAQC